MGPAPTPASGGGRVQESGHDSQGHDGQGQDGQADHTRGGRRARAQFAGRRWGRPGRGPVQRRGGAGRRATGVRGRRDRAEGQRAGGQDDRGGEAAAAAAALRRAGHRRRRARRGGRRVQPGRPGPDQPAAAHRGGAVPAAHPDPVRVRHHPRLPDHLPDPARRGQRVRPLGGAGRRHGRRPGDRHGRHQAGLLADGRRLARAALGPDRRGQRRGPVPGLGVRGGPGEGRPGQLVRGPGQGRGQRQAPGRVRAAGGRPGLQHHRHVRAAAAQPLPAAVQGRDRRRRRHGDVLVQRDQRRPGLRELAHRDRHREEGVGPRRLHRERLHRRRGAAGVPAGQPGHRPVRARRGRGRAVGRGAVPQRRDGPAHGQHRDPGLRPAAASQR